jgi:hypothetical protein
MEEGAPESAFLVVATGISDPVAFRVYAERVAAISPNWLPAIPLSCRPPRALLARWWGGLPSPVAAGSSVGLESCAQRPRTAHVRRYLRQVDSCCRG